MSRGPTNAGCLVDGCDAPHKAKGYCRNHWHRSRDNREMYRRHNLWRSYRITPEQFDSRLEAQGGGCAICGCTSSGVRGRSFHVDHDHACCPGKTSCGNCIRGLLCHSCNTALGGFKDDTALMAGAIAYIDSGGVR